jgi:hypothetical protein
MGFFVEQGWRFSIGVWKEKESTEKSTSLKGLARKHNHQTGNHHKGVVRVDCKSMNMCIDLGSTIENSYAQSNNSTIQIWYCFIWNLTRSWIPMRYRTSPSFQRVFTCPHSSNGLSDMTFCKTTELLKLYFCTNCSHERKMKSEAVQLGFFPWAEYQNGGKLSQLSISYWLSLIRQMV